MTSSQSDGLGFSLAVYLAAILGALAVIALPVYFATRTQVYPNPPLARADPLLNGPVVGERVPTSRPVAMLKKRTIVDPATLAALNAKAEKAAPARQPARRAASRPNRTPVADNQTEPQHHTFFLFNLFNR